MKQAIYQRNPNAPKVSVLDNTTQGQPPIFKTEWNWKTEARKMRVAIATHFNKISRSTGIKTMHGELPRHAFIFQAYAEKFGLPYTSSSSYAAYWVTNTEVYNEQFPGYHYEGFALSVEGEPFAILQDENENAIYLPL